MCCLGAIKMPEAEKCYPAYLQKQLRVAQNVIGDAKDNLLKALKIQKTGYDGSRMRERQYSSGDLVWLRDEVNSADKVHPFHWSGPHVVLEPVNQLNNVLLRMEDKGLRTVEKYVNVAHIKPVLYKCNGEALVLVHPDEYENLDLTEALPCGLLLEPSYCHGELHEH